jgi:hypothetical protein
MDNFDKRFTMEEPREIGLRTHYAFWLTTSEKRLIRAVREAGCVARLMRSKDGRILVEIRDEFDPDEAWHYIRAAVEEAAQYVELDDIWEDAMKWL